MLQVKNLTIEYSRILFKNISFLIGSNEKVGLVGLNGCGKSTLLKIIMGIEVPDGGAIVSLKEKIEYLPQEFEFKKDQFVGEYIEGLVHYKKEEMWKVKKVLNKLDLGAIDEFQHIHTLSPGQKMKFYLAKMLVNEPTILLLDEPTNHLDINGIIWFENFIKEFSGIAIIISHDREFLNSTVNKIFEIDEQNLYIFEGNYDDYLEQKETFKEERALQYRLQERKREQLENLLERARKIADGKKRSSAVSSAKRRIEREVTSVEVQKYKEQKIHDLKLTGHVHNSKLVLRLKGVSYSYDSTKKLLENVNFEMFGKEKVWLYGQNGIGKSTLIKLITGDLIPSNGKITIGENLRWTYFSQEHNSLPPEMGLHEYFLEQTRVDYNSSFGVLNKFLFTKEMFQTKLRNLSPGQRSRLFFAIFSLSEYDFLILDEPTNHLDIQTKEVIEEALRNFRGAIFLVSHDRYFVRSIGIDRIITIKDGKLE
jgi:ATP-binding cassette subfamily F protein 3